MGEQGLVRAGSRDESGARRRGPARARPLLAAVALVAVVVGVPVGLVLLVGDPLPTAVPSTESLHLALASGNVQPQTWLKVLAVVGWLVWARLAWVAATEVVAAAAAWRSRIPYHPRRPRSPMAHLVGMCMAATALSQATHLPLAQVIARPAATSAPLPHALGSARPTTAPLHPATTLGSPTTPAVALRQPSNGSERPGAQTDGRLTRYVVQPRDTLWGIASKQLGDPLRWREIWALNEGRSMGDGLRLEDPSLIEPGWVLLLPGTGTASREAPPTASPRAGSGSTSRHPSLSREPGAGLTIGQEARPATPERVAPAGQAPALEHPAVAAQGGAGGGVPTPRQPVEADQPAGSGQPAVAAQDGSGGAPVAPADSPPPTAAPAPTPANDLSGVPAPLVALGGAGLLAAGLLLEVRRRQRRQARARRPGRRVRLPVGPTAAVAADLSAAADRDGLARVHTAVRLLGQALRAIPQTGAAPVLRTLTLSDGSVEIDLTDTAANGHGEDPEGKATTLLPAPFRREGTGWALPADALAAACAETDESGGSIAPLLVCGGPTGIGEPGSGPRRSAYHLVNLELYGAIALRAENSEQDESGALDALHGLALQLATAPWAEVAEVVVVGGPTSLAELERVRTEATLAGAFPSLWQAHASTKRSLEARGFSSVHEARLRDDDPCWWPTAVLVADGAEPEGLRELAKLAKPGSGLVAVVASPSPGFSPLPGASEHPGVSIDDPTLTGLADLVRTVSDTADVAPDAAPYDQLGPVERSRPSAVTGEGGNRRASGTPLESPGTSRSTGDPNGRAGRPEAPDATSPGTSAGIGHTSGPMPASAGHGAGTPDRSGVAAASRDSGSRPPDEGVEVRILGPVEVAGAALPPRGSRVLELLAYLAVHPRGTRTEQWETALWLDQRPSAGARRNLLYHARRCLGSASDGASHVLVEAGSARLGPEVGTDWARFRRLAEEPASWRAALELVRGRPLSGIGEANWALTEGHSVTIEAEVLDLALALAERSLANDAPDTAEWAARRGLTVSPWDERLYRAWMRAADAAGRRSAVEAAWRQLNGILQVDGDGTESPELETVELYRSLRGAARDPSMTP